MPTVTGPLLRRERLAADVKVTAIAARMGLSRQTVHALERDAEPDAGRVVDYREAIAAEVAVKVAARRAVA